VIITRSPPPHVNDFYGKLMMSKCPLREKERRKETEGREEAEGELASVHNRGTRSASAWRFL